jgi:hypothetical protein
MKSLSPIRNAVHRGTDFRIAAASPLLQYCLIIQTLWHITHAVNDRNISRIEIILAPRSRSLSHDIIESQHKKRRVCHSHAASDSVRPPTWHDLKPTARQRAGPAGVSLPHPRRTIRRPPRSTEATTTGRRRDPNLPHRSADLHALAKRRCRARLDARSVTEQPFKVQ